MEAAAVPHRLCLTTPSAAAAVGKMCCGEVGWREAGRRAKAWVRGRVETQSLVFVGIVVSFA